MPTYRIRHAADLLGVSDDTLRRWIDAGRIATIVVDGRQAIDGATLAGFAVEQNTAPPHPDISAAIPAVRESARNRFLGLVTKVTRDTVMAQVEIQSGANRIVSLMSREAADELALEPGVLAYASVKATNVVVELAQLTTKAGKAE
ncbi:molybdopterin-binding protein [Jatrophihabitans sp. GAS493]|uniref:TOBE domain-containing protein n=1 Tax=Jatrophihabitans sp. GAS493 TaxID=1907575 RepID=UPI000BB904F0|nr:TOBE domain-containing protein [Jatrophihabitans sp. GAS493]SOD70756.1 molybdopterin-binding protein [Jatrophihabitans sp. GAS493]